MLDRESTFKQPELVALLKSRFAPVAIDQAYQRRQKDAEGEFYRKIAGQGPRHDFRRTTQGFYVASAGGELLLYNNNRDPKKVQRLVRAALGEFERRGLHERAARVLRVGKKDVRYNPTPPDGGLVVRVRAKVLGGYEKTENRWRKIFQNALSRDNLWVTKREHDALAGGVISKTLQRRLVRFHLVDNTRGEPPMWKADEIRTLDFAIDREALRLGRQPALRGRVHVETQNGQRGYEAELLGAIEVEDGRVTHFDIVALGRFWGEGRYTKRAPEGKFPLAVSFSLADGTDLADAIPPQGSRGWVAGYLR